MAGMHDIENLQTAVSIGHIRDMVYHRDIERHVGCVVNAQRHGIGWIRDVHDPQPIIGIRDVRQRPLHDQALGSRRQVEHTLAHGRCRLGYVHDHQVFVFASNVRVAAADASHAADRRIRVNAKQDRRGRVLNINDLQAILCSREIG